MIVDIDEKRLNEIKAATDEYPVALTKDEAYELNTDYVMAGLHHGRFKLAYPLAETVEAPTT
jgi:hypothetical protein